MASTLVYVAGPIDQVNGLSWGDGWLDIRQFTRKALSTAGFDTYSPGRAFEVGTSGPAGLHIDTINRMALDQSAAVVAFLPMNVATLGTSVEIDQSIRNGKPVLIISNISNSVQIQAWEQPDHVKVVLPRQSGIEEGLDWLSRQVAAGVLGRTSQVDLPFRALSGGAILPTRGYADDAGFDLYTSKDTFIPPNAFIDVPTDVAVDLPDGTWGMITGRSSTLRKKNLLVATGIIDNGWTGPLFAGCRNLADTGIMVKEGERVAQMILFPTTALPFRAAWGDIRTKARGERGFGSTGD